MCFAEIAGPLKTATDRRSMTIVSMTSSPWDFDSARSRQRFLFVKTPPFSCSSTRFQPPVVESQISYVQVSSGLPFLPISRSPADA